MIALTREHTNTIRAVVLKTIGGRAPSDLVADLVQDTALQLLEESGSRSLKEYDPDRGMSLSTFIGMVAKSVTLDHLRRNNRMVKRERPLDDTEDGDGLQAEAIAHEHGEDALSMLIRREQRERLTAVLDVLSSEDRMLLEALLTGDEYTVKQLADKMGITDGALRVRKYRMAERVRRALQSQG